MLVIHEVADYKKWKPYFDASKFIRDENGIKKMLHLLREVDDKNDVVIMFEVSDLAKAKAFSGSKELHDIMKMAGVIGIPEIYFLSEDNKKA